MPTRQAITNNNKKNLIKAMHKSLGVISTACREAGLNRDTYYSYYKNDPEFKKACDQAHETAKDFAESALFANIRDGKEVSTIFFLKSRAKDRGYIEKQELDVNAKITIKPINYGNCDAPPVPTEVLPEATS